MYFRVAIVVTALTLSACSSWVFRYDVPQGNYLEKKAIKKLQVGMTKEQVKYILGSHVVVDAFNNDTWSYVYRLKSGRGDKFNRQRKLILNFSNDALISATGDYALSENFNTPFNEVESTALDNNVSTSVIAEGSDVDEETAADTGVDEKSAAEAALEEINEESD